MTVMDAPTATIKRSAQKALHRLSQKRLWVPCTETKQKIQNTKQILIFTERSIISDC